MKTNKKKNRRNYGSNPLIGFCWFAKNFIYQLDGLCRLGSILYRLGMLFQNAACTQAAFESIHHNFVITILLHLYYIETR
jgi:hypothetical protein